MPLKKTRVIELTLNKERQLYVIKTEVGVSCLGFDVCQEKSKRLSEWLNARDVSTPKIGPRGSEKAYRDYLLLCSMVEIVHGNTGEKCDVELTEQLIGLEGKRVEVTDCHGETRRFWVARSSGWTPVHLEIKRRNSISGLAVSGAPFKELKVIK